MATTPTRELASPPPAHDMTVLDRSHFKRTVPISILSIPKQTNIQRVKRVLTSSHDILVSKAITPVINDPNNPSQKGVLLLPHIKADDPSTWKPAWAQLIHDGTAKIRPYDLNLTYDEWTMSDILDAILPPSTQPNNYNDDPTPTTNNENPSGFAQIGHIAHLNLREVFTPYKTLIAQVLLDKNPTIRTVINKRSDVGTESIYRTFPYEILAGDPTLDVVVRHADCEFQFNFGDVYWNTRNGSEQERLVSTFEPGEVVCDVMAGVGPFAVPSAKKGVWVWANDLNPACYDSLCNAIKTNKVTTYVRAYNMDGAGFIKYATSQLLELQRIHYQPPKGQKKISRLAPPADKKKFEEYRRANSTWITEPRTFDHFVMNLPATAIEFLPAFRGIYAGRQDLFNGSSGRKLPMVHVYVFQARKETEAEEKAELLGRLSEHVGYQLDAREHEVNLHRARLVAPNKLYYCASFRLPGSVAFGAPGEP